MLASLIPADKDLSEAHEFQIFLLKLIGLSKADIASQCGKAGDSEVVQQIFDVLDGKSDVSQLLSNVNDYLDAGEKLEDLTGEMRKVVEEEVKRIAISLPLQFLFWITAKSAIAKIPFVGPAYLIWSALQWIKENKKQLGELVKSIRMALIALCDLGKGRNIRAEIKVHILGGLRSSFSALLSLFARSIGLKEARVRLTRKLTELREKGKKRTKQLLERLAGNSIFPPAAITGNRRVKGTHIGM